MSWTTIKEHIHTLPSGARVRIVVDSTPDYDVCFADACPEITLEEISNDEYRRIESWDPDVHARACALWGALQRADMAWNGVETDDFTLTSDGRYQITVVPYHEYEIGESFEEGDTVTWRDDRGQRYVIRGGDGPEMVRYAIRVLDGDIAFYMIRARVWRTDAAEPWDVAGESLLGMVEDISESIPDIAHKTLREAGIDNDTATTIISEIM